MRKVDAGQINVFPGDVLPDVELGPVREREHADVLATPDTAVEQSPRFGSLQSRIPLAKGIAKGEDSLLGTGFVLVTACTSNRSIDLVLGDSVEQGGRLKAVT